MIENYNHIRANKIISQMYFLCLALMVISIPLSKFMMSVSQFTLSGILILQFISFDKANQFFLKRPWYQITILIIPVFFGWMGQSLYRIFKKFLRRENLPAIVFSSLYILHLSGLLFTIDFDYALKDLRIKLPLFVLPIILSVSNPLSRKQFRNLMLLFSGTVVLATFISVFVMLTRDVESLREISIFISHIRFSLLISLAIFALGFYGIRHTDLPKNVRILLLVATCWLLIYLVLSASITGLVVLILAAFVLSINYSLKKKNLYSRTATVILLLTPIVLFVFIMGIVSDVYKIHRTDFSELETQTEKGNYYWHDTNNLQTENGHYVWLYICDDELRETWNERSDYDFDGEDRRRQVLRFTLYRYMASEGLKKDASGIDGMSDEDIAMVEDGEASALYHHYSDFYIRLYKTIWETQQYFRTGDPSGHSAMQRVEYWKTSALIIKQNPLVGVGTGDMNIAFKEQYESMNSPLKPEFRWRSHNQFLSIGVGFGLSGFIWFIFALLYPPLKTRRLNDYFYLAFFVIMIVSMMSEDTIETQAGVTIFAFFTSLFLFGKKDKTII